MDDQDLETRERLAQQLHVAGQERLRLEREVERLKAECKLLRERYDDEYSLGISDGRTQAFADVLASIGAIPGDGGIALDADAVATAIRAHFPARVEADAWEALVSLLMNPRQAPEWLRKAVEERDGK